MAVVVARGSVAPVAAESDPRSTVNGARALPDTGRLRWLVPLALVATGIAWLGAREVATWLAGPPGLDVTVWNGRGEVIRHERVRALMTPDTIAPPPPGS